MTKKEKVSIDGPPKHLQPTEVPWQHYIRVLYPLEEDWQCHQRGGGRQYVLDEIAGWGVEGRLQLSRGRWTGESGQRGSRNNADCGGKYGRRHPLEWLTSQEKIGQKRELLWLKTRIE